MLDYFQDFVPREPDYTKKPPSCKAVLKSPVKADTTIAKLEQEAAKAGLSKTALIERLIGDL